MDTLYSKKHAHSYTCHTFSSAWTGQQLAECSLYGIRVYPEGAVLATHVDRLPLVSSAIINVDQDGTCVWHVVLVLLSF